MYFAYSLLTAAALLLLTPYLAVQGVWRKKYLPNLRERLGLRFPPELRGPPGSGAGANWVHAVSVGEALAAVPIARGLKERFPERRLVVSTTTATGQALARERMSFADAIFYFPLDWPASVRRALRAVRPELVVMVETEIWPNFMREARRAGVPVVFVNGRLSERSYRRYVRALRWSGGALGGFLRHVLDDARLYLMQSESDARRLVALGAPAGRVNVTGNVKYDVAPGERNALCLWLRAELARSGRGPLLVAGSLVAGEEAAVLAALAMVEQKWPDALLLMAPRKPERFAAAAALLEQDARRVVRRSALGIDGAAEEASPGVLRRTPGERGSILLLDTIGELAATYQLADVVFIGGSLVPAGGHNPLEPAAVGKAPVFGTFMENFREIAAALVKADAAIEVQSAAELGVAWTGLLADALRNARMGSAASAVVEANRGATAMTLEHLARVAPPSQRSS